MTTITIHLLSRKFCILGIHHRINLNQLINQFRSHVHDTPSLTTITPNHHSHPDHHHDQTIAIKTPFELSTPPTSYRLIINLSSSHTRSQPPFTFQISLPRAISIASNTPQIRSDAKLHTELQVRVDAPRCSALKYRYWNRSEQRKVVKRRQNECKARKESCTKPDMLWSSP